MSPYRENSIFDDVIITSALYSDNQISKENFTRFSKTYLRDNVCQKVYNLVYIC